MQPHFCHSCGAPLQGEFQGPSPIYCAYCADEDGSLKSREQIKRGIASWLQTWSPALEPDAALRRAEHYMLAMPTWAPPIEAPAAAVSRRNSAKPKAAPKPKRKAKPAARAQTPRR